jgi:prenyltransferase beta subunit
MTTKTKECNVCGKQVFKNKDFFEKHLQFHKDKILPKDNKICFVCDTPIHEKSLVRHIKSIHGQESLNQYKENNKKEKKQERKIRKKQAVARAESGVEETKGEEKEEEKEETKEEIKEESICDKNYIFPEEQRQKLAKYQMEYKRKTGKVKSAFVPRPRRMKLIINGIKETDLEFKKRLKKESNLRFRAKKAGKTRIECDNSRDNSREEKQ